jgi:hypothetical protein
VQALKRKHDESQQENLVYKELYRLLVSVTEAEALDILQRLRAGTDVETAVRLAQEGDLLLQLALKPESRFRYQFPYLPFMPAALQTSDNPFLESLLYEGALQGFSQPPHQQHQHQQQLQQQQQHQQQSSSAGESSRASSYNNIYLKPYHAAELVDGRLASVKASDWTSVTTDDHLFRRLLRAYLVHEYCVAPAFQKDYFLFDLARGKGPLCSPLLVNSVMAIGSVRATHTPYVFCPGGIGLIRGSSIVLPPWQCIPVTDMEPPKYWLQVLSRGKAALGVGGSRKRQVDHVSSDDTTESGLQ